MLIHINGILSNLRQHSCGGIYRLAQGRNRACVPARTSKPRCPWGFAVRWHCRANGTSISCLAVSLISALARPAWSHLTFLASGSVNTKDILALFRNSALLAGPPVASRTLDCIVQLAFIIASYCSWFSVPSVAKKDDPSMHPSS